MRSASGTVEEHRFKISTRHFCEAECYSTNSIIVIYAVACMKYILECRTVYFTLFRSSRAVAVRM